MTVQERIVSVRRHTLGYVISGREYTRKQAVVIARKGAIPSVRIVRTSNGPHLVGVGRSLYSLPTRVGVRTSSSKRTK